jgi:ethanolamine utilization protein EutN
MMLGKVIGKVWATRQDEKLKGISLKVIQPVNERGEILAKGLVAADRIGARHGDLVYWVSGPEGSVYRPDRRIPCDCLIVGIVDEAGS